MKLPVFDMRDVRPWVVALPRPLVRLMCIVLIPLQVLVIIGQALWGALGESRYPVGYLLRGAFGRWEDPRRENTHNS